MQALDVTFPQNTTRSREAVYASLMVDGNTELKVHGWERKQMSKRLLGLLRHIDEDTDATARLICIRRPWAAGEGTHEALPASRAWRTGRARARVYHIEIPGAFHLTFNERYSTASVQLAASMLWSVGYAASAAWTIRALHQEIFGALKTSNVSRFYMLRYDRPLESAAEAGWRISRAEVCTDFADYPIDADSKHLGFKTKATLFGVDMDTGACETLSLGGGSSAMRLRIYDKRAECASGGDDTSWKYAEVWRRNGWTEGASVFRVEMVLQGAGLEIESPDAEGLEVDLTNPAALAEPEALAKAWKFHAFRKRRIELTASRRERCWTHPDWQRVIDAAQNVEAFEPLSYRQRRQAQAGACDTMAERDTAAAINAALRYAAREIGVSSTIQLAGGWDNPDYDSDGVGIVDHEKTAAATRLLVQVGFEAMLANASSDMLSKKSGYLEKYAALKHAEMGEEMLDRASRYVLPPESFEAWRARETHTPPAFEPVRVCPRMQVVIERDIAARLQYYARKAAGLPDDFIRVEGDA